VKLEYHLSDVFTDRVFGGNQLAVFPRAEGLRDDLMQRIARELNLSESVFVMPATNRAHAAKLRIFTPRMELPFAGHPTVGTAATLLRLGIVKQGEAVLEENVGAIVINAREENGRYFAEFTARQSTEVREEVAAREILADLISLRPEEIDVDALRPLAVSAGVPFIFIPVKERAALGRIQVNLSVWKQHIAHTWAPHIYTLHVDANNPADTRVRMFAPAMGIAEDPATGGAAAALPTYLHHASRGRATSQKWRVEQGIEMGRPSIIDVSALIENGRLAGARIGGETVFVGTGALDLNF
jgi:trans-2,3-dihydro-3-hydroxyanthranilate isomerase